MNAGKSRDDVTEFCEAVWRQERPTVGSLARRVDPNGKDRWGRTPLLIAAQYGDLALVAELVRRGGVIDQQRRYLTPLTLAARRKAADIMAFLMERGASVSIVTAIHLGDRKRCAQELKRKPELVRLRDEEGTPLLHHAVEALQPQLVRLVLGHGGSTSDVDAKGETGLHRIADMRQVPQGPAAKMAGLLLDRGADPNARNWDDVTPLHQAVRARNIAVTKLLLAHGADPNARDRGRGSTPLRRAVSASGAGGTSGRGAQMRLLTQMLLEHGADPSAQDKRGVPVYASARDPTLRAMLNDYRGARRGPIGRDHISL
jgi:ankyrin repeat protein